MSYVLILNVIIFNEQIKLNNDKQYEKYYIQDTYANFKIIVHITIMISIVV